MKKRKNGFTLVELLAVIVVLALIMAIAIPAILSTLNQAKKESFYLYAQSIQSKAIAAYTQDIESDKEVADCVVYDIGTDLDLSDTGTYEGWVKVNRKAVDSDQRVATITVNSDKVLEYVNYCVAKGNDCTPDSSYNFPEGSKTVTISQTIKENQVMCVNYQYGENGVLKTSSKTCKNYGASASVVQEYDYDVTLTFKDNDYYVENVIFNDTITKKDFYKIIDENNKLVKEKIANKEVNPLAISSPVCSKDDPITIKGTTTAKGTAPTTTTEGTTKKDPTTCPTLHNDAKNYNIVLNLNGGTLGSNVSNRINQCVGCSESSTIPEPTRAGYLFDGWYYDKTFVTKFVGNETKNIKISEKYDTANCVIGYNDVNIHAKWKIDPASTSTTTQGIYNDPTSTTTERSTTIAEEITTTEHSTVIAEETTTTTRGTEVFTTTTTTIDVTDYTLLLDTLNISGYNIDFSPIKFYYELTIPENVNSLSVSYQAHTPEKTAVQVLNNENIQSGTTWVVVRLTNTETAKESNYRILVTKLSTSEGKITTAPQGNETEWNPESGMPDPTLEESNAALSNLMISGYDLGFDPSVYDYTIKVYETSELKVSYETYAKNAIVNVDGATDLREGDVITIYTQSPNGFYHKTYTITVQFIEQTSNQTKFLRTAAIILGIALIIILAITSANKKRNFSIIKKKVKDNNNDNNNNPDNVA